MERLICLAIGYAFGLIQTGYIVGRFNKIDIRKYGSNNSGTTNVLRTLGSKCAAVVLLGDALKCILAVIVCKCIFMNSCASIISTLMLYAAFGVILGHNFPFYMHFKGGKGIAATLGLALSYCFQFRYGWLVTVCGVVVFALIFFTTHYVSLGSICAYIFLYIEIIFVGNRGLFGYIPGVDTKYLIEYYIVFFILTAMAIIRHKANIVRLLNKNERKTYLRSKPELKEG